MAYPFYVITTEYGKLASHLSVGDSNAQEFSLNGRIVHGMNIMAKLIMVKA